MYLKPFYFCHLMYFVEYMFKIIVRDVCNLSSFVPKLYILIWVDSQQ